MLAGRRQQHEGELADLRHAEAHGQRCPELISEEEDYGADLQAPYVDQGSGLDLIASNSTRIVNTCSLRPEFCDTQRWRSNERITLCTVRLQSCMSIRRQRSG